MVVLALSKLGMREIRKKSVEPDFFFFQLCDVLDNSHRELNSLAFHQFSFNSLASPSPLISPLLQPAFTAGYVGNGHVNGDVSAPRCVRFRVAGYWLELVTRKYL